MQQSRPVVLCRIIVPIGTGGGKTGTDDRQICHRALVSPGTAFQAAPRIRLLPSVVKRMLRSWSPSSQVGWCINKTVSKRLISSWGFLEKGAFCVRQLYRSLVVNVQYQRSWLPSASAGPAGLRGRVTMVSGWGGLPSGSRWTEPAPEGAPPTAPPLPVAGQHSPPGGSRAGEKFQLIRSSLENRWLLFFLFLQGAPARE